MQYGKNYNPEFEKGNHTTLGRLVIAVLKEKRCEMQDMCDGHDTIGDIDIFNF
jgi:hypothetical protein